MARKCHCFNISFDRYFSIHYAILFDFICQCHVNIFFKPSNFHRSKKSKDRRSRSKERRHKRSKSRSRSRSASVDRRRFERREHRERESREKEMEKERLREIAIEFRQSGVFNSLAQQAQGQSIPLLSPFPSLSSNFSMGQPQMLQQPRLMQDPAQPPKEPSRAYMEAVAASQRITATRNFTDLITNSNSNDSITNGQMAFDEFSLGGKIHI